MALVTASPEFRASIRLVSSVGKTMSVNIALTASLYADAVTAVGAFLTDLDGVSAGVVAGYSITSQTVNDALVLPTSEDAEYGERALITGTMDGNPLKSWSLYIPMPKIGIFMGTGVLRDTVDVSDAALLAYLANFTDVGDIATISDGEYIDIVTGGRRVN